MIVFAAFIASRLSADFILALVLWVITQNPDQAGDVAIPTSVVGLVGVMVTTVLGIAGWVIRNQSVERREHAAELKDLALRNTTELREQATRFSEVVRDMERRHEEENKEALARQQQAERRHEEEYKAMINRQQQIEERLTQVIIEVTVAQREVSTAVTNFIPLRELQEGIKRGAKSVR